MRTALIKDVTAFVLDGTHGSPVRTAVGIPVLSAQNVKDGRLDFETNRYTSDAEYDDFKKRLPLAVGDVLLTIVGTIGRSAVVDETRPLVFQRSVAVMRPKQGALWPRFLYHVSRTREFQAQLTRSSNQSSQAGVYLGKLKELWVPLPSLPKQQQIAEILDKADALRAKRRAALAQLDSLAQSIFLDMFGDPVTNPKRLPHFPLRETAKITTGGTPSRDVDGFFGGDIPWVKTTEIKGDAIHDTEEKLTEPGLRAIRGKLHPANSLVIAMYGQGKTRGHSGVLAIDAAVNQACAVVRPNPNFDSRFMLAQLRLGYERLRAMGRGGNQENLNLNLVGSFRVLVPSIAHQAAFVKCIDTIENLRAAGKSSLTQLDALFASLQRRAFRGEL